MVVGGIYPSSNHSEVIYSLTLKGNQTKNEGVVALGLVADAVLKTRGPISFGSVPLDIRKLNCCDMEENSRIEIASGGWPQLDCVSSPRRFVLQ